MSKNLVCACRLGIPGIASNTYYILEEDGIYSMDVVKEGNPYYIRRMELWDVDKRCLVYNIKYDLATAKYSNVNFGKFVRSIIKTKIELFKLPESITNKNWQYFSHRFILATYELQEGTLDEIINRVCGLIREELMDDYVIMTDLHPIIEKRVINPYEKLDNFFIHSEITFRNLCDDAGFVFDCDLSYRQDVNKKTIKEFMYINKKDIHCYVLTLIYRFLKKRKSLENDIIRYIWIAKILIMHNSRQVRFIAESKNIK